MAKRAVLYARVSSDDRAKEGRNLAGQLNMCREYAQEQGWEIVDEIAEDDRGAKGAALDLPALGRVRRMAADGKLDVLVVREIDRLARSLAKQLIVEEELRRSGVQIAYVLGEYPDTPEGNLNKNIKAVIAEYEAMKISERTNRAIRNMVEDGSVMVHGKPPYGYRIGERDGKRTLEIDEEQARIVKLIFDWYTDPEHSISIAEIARRLDRMGVERPKARSKPGKWSPITTHLFLGRETYAGTWHYGKQSSKGRNPKDQLIPVAVPAIVSRETWDRAQERLRTNRENSKRNTKHEYLLRRRVRCADCRAKMVSVGKQQPNHLYLYYHCQTRWGAGHCENHLHFRADVVDTAVWNKIKSWLLSPDKLREALRARQDEEEQRLAPVRKELEVIEDLLCHNREQLDRLLDLYLGGEFPKEMLVERRRRIEETIASLEAEERELTAKLEYRVLTGDQVESIQEFLAKVAKAFEEAEDSFETRRRVVEVLNVEVRLERVDDEYKIHIECHVGKESLSVASNTPRHGYGSRSGCRAPGSGGRHR